MSIDDAVSPGVSPLPLDVANHIDQICDDFDAEWKAGRRPKLERFLHDEDEVTLPILLHELLNADIERRRKIGEVPTSDDYVGRFPGGDAVVHAVFDQNGNSATEKYSLPTPKDPPGRGEGWPSEFSTFNDEPHTPSLPAIEGYEVLGEQGRGGMGIVYRAREVRLNRIVALKMILAGIHAGHEASARFLYEAEVIARLRHPNIVQVFSLGDHDGRPYLELEFVEGGTLSKSLGGTPRPAIDSASLVETLARAVHEAHSCGVIHRDLKPANVLLTADGQPKIADFGLAKAVGGDSGLTKSDAPLGSPSYMAPEQTGGSADMVGVACDVYALGSILYEMLTGRPPFRAATALGTLVLVRSALPIPPSRFQPNLPRDVETICLKCLEKDPARRYPDAKSLADDLRRYLDGRPITARRVGPVGRFRRWCVREPKEAALIATLALTVALAFATVTWSWRSAVDAKVEAIDAKKRAEDRFQQAVQVVEDLTKTTDELKGSPELDTIRRRMLEKVASYYDEFLKEKADDQRFIRASAHASIKVGLIRGELGQIERCGEAFAHAGELYARLLKELPTDPETRFDRAWSFYWSGNFQNQRRRNAVEAEKYFESAIALMTRLADEFPKTLRYRSDLALFLNNWAFVRRVQGRPEGAEEAANRAIALQREVLEVNPKNIVAVRHLALALHDLSVRLTTVESIKEAEAASRESVTRLRDVILTLKTADFLRPYLARAQNRLAEILEQTGRISEAESLRRRSLDDLQELVHDSPNLIDYRVELALTATGYARLADSVGHHEQAIAAYREAFTQTEKLAADFPENPIYLNQLAWARVTCPERSLNAPDQAVRLARKTVTLAPNVADYWNTLGVALYRAGDFLAAKQALEKSVSTRRVGITTDWLFLAMTCKKLGNDDEGRKWYETAIQKIKAGDTNEVQRFKQEADAMFAPPAKSSP